MTNNVREMNIVMFFSFLHIRIANECLYYALTLSTPSLAGNRFMNYFLSGFMEIPAYTLGYIFAKT